MKNSETYFRNFESIDYDKKSILFIAGAGMDHRLVRSLKLPDAEFNKPLIISLSIFFIFMIYTSSVKHKTRNLEKKINNLNSEIGVLKKQLKDAKTDYVFLSSPEQLNKYLITLNINCH